MSDNKQFINLSNLRIFWNYICEKFSTKTQVLSLENRINELEIKLKKITSE
jgi:hypothetical protein